MNKKTRKLIFTLSTNARITTKALGQLLRTSQQSVSYQIKQLLAKKLLLGYVVLADPAMLGLVNVLVGFNLLDQSQKAKKTILDKFLTHKDIIAVYEGDQGIDLLVEFCTSNLSAFNKQYHELIHDHHTLVETRFIYPVIVKHRYLKNYLINKPDTADIVLCGDRKKQGLSQEERTVLTTMILHPDFTLVALAKETNLSVKTVMTIKKRLEQNKIIRGYSCFFNLQELGIRRYQIFLCLKPEGIFELDKLVEFAKNNKNVTGVDKIIGPYQIMLTVEEFEKTSLLKELRTTFPIQDYFIVDVERIQKVTYLPVPLPE